MKVSTKTRYGVRLMINLAVKYGEDLVLLKDVAREEEISEKYLSQIIMPLKAAGLVNSFRGSKGGYTLSKSPKMVTMGEIVSVLEGGVNLVDCVNQPQKCMRISMCVTQDLWGRVNKGITDLLGSITLNEMVQQCKAKCDKALLYSI